MIECYYNLDAPPMVGDTYGVPCVFYWWGRHCDWWPVMPPLHGGSVQFPDPDHWHIDVRFTTAEQDAVTKVHKETSASLFEDLDKGVMPRETVLRPRECRRSRALLAPIPQLGERVAFEALGARPKPIVRDGVRRCPHPGAILNTVHPNRDGTITCPMHVLRLYPNG